MALVPRNTVTTIAPPFILAPTGKFEGYDGNWSTFAIEVGTPPQSFRILPATIGEEIWLPLSPQACAGVLAGLSNCGELRGVNDFQGEPSGGFQYNQSSTWNPLSLYTLTTEQYLYGSDDVGSYGMDTVALGTASGGGYGAEIEKQVIAGTATENFWMGSLGLGSSSGAFDAGNWTVSSLMQSMKTQNLIASLSYAYSAGKSYSFPTLNGSLILGGYDRSLMSKSIVTVPINSTTGQQRLQLPVQSIYIESQGGAQMVALKDSIDASIDSATSQLWLPNSTCDFFAQQFGLTYDSETDLYLLNDSMHAENKKNDPVVTFTVGNQAVGSTTNIELAYSAFDTMAGIPIYNTSTRYFSIRRTANESQYTLGRTFLQEAYLVVDWERSNFTIGPLETANGVPEVVPIFPLPTSNATNATTPAASSHPTAPPSKSGITTGTIAGIVIAMILCFTVGLGLGFFFLRRKRRTKTKRGSVEEIRFDDKHFSSGSYYDKKLPEVEITELPMSEIEDEQVRRPSELASVQIHEMEDLVPERQLMSTPIMELQGENVGSELDVCRAGREGEGIAEPRSPRSMFELE